MNKFLVVTLLFFFVVHLTSGLTYSEQLDFYCSDNYTKGIYLLDGRANEPSSRTCCDGKGLTSPGILTSPIRTSCRANVTRDNVDDDIPTLISKTQACLDQNIMAQAGIPVGEINFKTFVKYRMTNYPNDSSIRDKILHANTDCPEGDKETELYKKLEAYLWCFIRNEEKICHKPPEQARKELELNHKSPVGIKMNQTCPGLPVSAWQFYHCCRGKQTSYPWTFWVLNDPSDDVNNLSNETEQCIKRTEEIQTNRREGRASGIGKDELFYLTSCRTACILNPVVFKNGTTGPKKMDWRFEDSVRLHFNRSGYSSKHVNELTEIAVTKAKGSVKITLTFKDQRKGTGKTFDEIEKMYNESSDLETRVALYCSYYDTYTLKNYVMEQYCGIETADDAARSCSSGTIMAIKLQKHMNIHHILYVLIIASYSEFA